MFKRAAVLTAAIALLVVAGGECAAVGKYCLAFWRETGSYEKGGIGGTHIINVHVWDENGNPLSGKHVYSSALDMGATDSNGQVELTIYEPNSYPLRIVDGSNLTDTTPGFSSYRPPDWGHYSFECGFVYVSDSQNAPTFDLNYDGIFNSSSLDNACNNFQMSAPKTRSLAFCSTRPAAGYYCSDGWESGSSVTSVGQTFQASGNRVVACKFSPTGGSAQYYCRIREGGPTGAYVGAAATSPSFGAMDYSKTLVKWGLAAVPVTSGQTYFLEITKVGGGSFAVNRVINNNDPNGCYYEGTTPNTYKELRGEVVCATVGATATGAITGWVKDTGGAAISGATVSTTTGGYSTTTGESGIYTLSNVAVGTYSVTASKTGYSPQTNTGVVVSSGQTTTSNFTLTASAGGTIAGYVRDAQSAAISGATVSTNTGGYSTTSGADGSYTLSSVAAGDYNVTASKTGYNQQTQYGVRVNSGQTTTVNFTLAATFSGIANGNFEGGFYNDPDADHQSGNSWHRFSLSGSSKSGGDYGQYRSSHWSQSIYESTWTAGIYQQATGAAVGNKYTAAAWVKATDTSVLFWVGIDPTGGTNASSANVQWSGQTAPGGTWTQISKQVVAQNGTITMFVKAQNTVAANRYAWIDDATLTDDGPTTGTITGYVRDTGGSPLSGATVATTSGGYSTTSQANGSYTLTGVAPSTYTMQASKSGYVTQQIANVVVAAGGTTTANFNLPDASPPTTPVVTDDGAYTTNATQLQATWTSSDPESGISEYQYAIGTDPGATNVVGWTSAGTATGVTATGLNLGYVQPYYFSVKARNRDNLWSAVGSSDGIRAARALPSVAAAKAFANGECVQVAGKIVTALFADRFYIEDGSRASGIRVSGASAAEGSTVTVTGVLATLSGERTITDAQVQ